MFGENCVDLEDEKHNMYYIIVSFKCNINLFHFHLLLSFRLIKRGNSDLKQDNNVVSILILHPK